MRCIESMTYVSISELSPGYTPIQNTLFIMKSVLSRGPAIRYVTSLISGLPDKVAAKEQACTDLAAFQPFGYLVPRLAGRQDAPQSEIRTNLAPSSESPPAE